VSPEQKQQSISPEGEIFDLPSPQDYATRQGPRNRRGHGVGFVGAVMAAVVADSVDDDGKPGKFVIGMQRPSTRSYWKIPYLNRGEAPVEAEDPEVAPMIERCVLEKKTLTATYSYDALSLADVVVVDVQCDYTKRRSADVRQGTRPSAPWKTASR
jgi:UDP-N-acetyl-D-glucosamine dehydrogenase